MYIHIGKDYIIKSDKIITIINIEKKTEEIENLIKKINIDKKIIDISENNKKSLIIYKEKENIKSYITNISSITLAKRMEKDII